MSKLNQMIELQRKYEGEVYALNCMIDNTNNIYNEDKIVYNNHGHTGEHKFDKTYFRENYLIPRLEFVKGELEKIALKINAIEELLN